MLARLRASQVAKGQASEALLPQLRLPALALGPPAQATPQQQWRWQQVAAVLCSCCWVR